MQLYDAASLSDGDLEQILSFLRAGGVIAFPTDTAYGLGADPFQAEAVQRIFQIKGRPETKPILLLVNSIAMAESVADLSGRALELAKRFWPGPLTMVVPARSTVPDLVTAGTGTIGIRWPDATFARRLIDAFERPVTATSANRTGMPSAITVAEIREQFQDSIDVIVDGGTLPTRGGSTLLDLTETPARLLREGPIPKAELSDVLR
ncbi:MAG TPA: L-threonylcarbamoyladenylate synthase [Terriglobia bacterium]|nr:L-threonylcarbamoyladenylate synthase [Terriglobia bacterium]